MATSGHAAALRKVRGTVRAPANRLFLRDLKGQIEEDEFIQQLLDESDGEPRRVAVTFDRKFKDQGFSYAHFDLLLSVLDRSHGGTGIRKPCNQMRTLIWRGKRAQLLSVLRHFSKLHPTLRLRRLMILPCPTPATGWRIDPGIHMQMSGA